jgi:hypothetical protein
VEQRRKNLQQLYDDSNPSGRLLLNDKILPVNKISDVSSVFNSPPSPEKDNQVKHLQKLAFTILRETAKGKKVDERGTFGMTLDGNFYGGSSSSLDVAVFVPHSGKGVGEKQRQMKDITRALDNLSLSTQDCLKKVYSSS